MNKGYSDLLHRSAEKWGLPVMPGRPLIDDRTSPYPRLEVVETMKWRQDKSPYNWATIQIVTLNGQWSFCASFSVHESGVHFGPFLKFCDPLPTRQDALRAAIQFLRSHGATKETRVSAWLNDIEAQEITPRQLPLW